MINTSVFKLLIRKTFHGRERKHLKRNVNSEKNIDLIYTKQEYESLTTMKIIFICVSKTLELWGKKFNSNFIHFWIQLLIANVE